VLTRFGGAALEAGDVMLRSTTVWRIAADPITDEFGNLRSVEYLVFGSGLSTGADELLPTTGTITSVMFVTNPTVLAAPPALAAEFFWGGIAGFSLAALDFAAGFFNGTLAADLTAGDDTSTRTYTAPLPPEGFFFLAGGGGNDTLVGGAGGFVDGGEGDDVLSSSGLGTAGFGGVQFEGGAGDDLITGNIFNDVLNGGEGLDRLRGGDGDDRLQGWLDRDWLRGEAGDDTLFGFGRELEPGEIFDGGTGRDVLFASSGSAPADFTDVQLISVETLDL